MVICGDINLPNISWDSVDSASGDNQLPFIELPACRRLLLPLLHAEKERLRNAVANRVPASRWQGILFRINCEIISG